MLRRVVNQSLVYWIAALVILLDQFTKYLVRANLTIGEAWTLWPGLAPFLNFIHIQNNGAAFGMFQSGGGLFTVIAIIVSLVIVYYTFRLPEGQWSLRLILGLQLGGALGNLIDRLLFGPVTDFISLLGLLNTPIFNLSDLSITVGVIVLVLMMWGESRHAKDQAAGATGAPVDADGASS